MSLARPLLLAAVLAGSLQARPATADHNVPVKAKFFKIWFVRAEAQCLDSPAPHMHSNPFDFPACDPAPLSTGLSFGPNGYMFLIGTVTLSDPAAPDLKFVARGKDIRVGADGTGPGFSGPITISGRLRLTDHDCDGTDVPCTVIDTPFPIPMRCGTSLNPPALPGVCKATTTWNQIFPPTGILHAGKRTSYEVHDFVVFDQSGVTAAFTQGVSFP